VKKNLCGIKGMNDLLPSSSLLWSETEGRIKGTFISYGYEEIRTPIVEHTDLFARGIGEVTDIVEKEMYSFTDHLNGDSLTLRPENTAAIARAVIEHNLTYSGPKKLWYYGPMFRHERPQRGRYRQFNQFGVEALGFDGPIIEAEQLFLISRLWSAIGFDQYSMPKLELNCLGTDQERLLFRSALIDYFSKYTTDLDEDSKRRLKSNPLRILDSKNPKLKNIILESPKMSNFLGINSSTHFNKLCELLDDFNLKFKMNSSLVRGLDYYNQTVFEWKHDSLGAQSTLCGGGRYDSLVEMIGGKPTPAFGFAIGMERLIDLIQRNDTLVALSDLDLYVVHLGDEAKKEICNFC
jgi:histidyl-tRNA synthetase